MKMSFGGPPSHLHAFAGYHAILLPLTFNTSGTQFTTSLHSRETAVEAKLRDDLARRGGLGELRKVKKSRHLELFGNFSRGGIRALLDSIGDE